MITYILYSNNLNCFVLLHITNGSSVIEWDYDTLVKLQIDKNDFITRPLAFTNDWEDIGIL